MARALIVGCGCAGSELGAALATEGWAVRGTSRSPEGAARIERAGLEGVVADPDRVGTVLEHVGDVAVVAWALGEATGPTAEAVNGPRLERILERLVDTPVRGFVLEAPTGEEGAAELVGDASRTWRIPARVVDADRLRPGEWVGAMRAAITSVIDERG